MFPYENASTESTEPFSPSVCGGGEKKYQVTPSCTFCHYVYRVPDLSSRKGILPIHLWFSILRGERKKKQQALKWSSLEAMEVARLFSAQ